MVGARVLSIVGAILLSVTGTSTGQVSIFGTLGQLRPEPISRADIERAIEFGLAASPEPYLLRQAAGRDSGTDNVVVGLVYTPFIRVAMTARNAWRNEQRRLTPDDIPAEVIAPEMEIAVRWPASACMADTPEPPGLPAMTAGLRGLPSPAQALRNGGPPLRVTAGTSAVAAYGPLRYDDVVMVAAFPMTFLRQDIDFVVAKEHSGGGCYRVGRIPEDELPNWR